MESEKLDCQSYGSRRIRARRKKKKRKSKKEEEEEEDNNEKRSSLLRFTSLLQKAGIKSLGPGLFIHSRGELRGIS